MAKEQEIMEFLKEKVFEPILNNNDTSREVKSGVNLTSGRMNKLNAKQMINYYWSTLAVDHSIKFSKKIKDEQAPSFEDVLEEFRDRFNEEWLKNNNFVNMHLIIKFMGALS